MATFPHDSFDFFYEQSGAGPRLLFCNGSGANTSTTEPLLRLFRRRFEVAVHDQRGLGQTGLHTDDLVAAQRGRWTMADYAGDALAFADHLEWETFLLIGVSSGGMVAQELAVTAPSRVERLALVCTSPGGAGGSSFPLHDLPNRLAADPTLAFTLADSRFTPEWLADHPGDAAMMDARRAVARRPRSAAELVGERLQLDARSRHDVWDRLPLITCPTLIACGRYDLIAPVDNGEAMATQIPNAESRVYEGGHTFFIQDRSALPYIWDFLTG